VRWPVVPLTSRPQPGGAGAAVAAALPGATLSTGARPACRAAPRASLPDLTHLPGTRSGAASGPCRGRADVGARSVVRPRTKNRDVLAQARLPQALQGKTGVSLARRIGPGRRRAAPKCRVHVMAFEEGDCRRAQCCMPEENRWPRRRGPRPRAWTAALDPRPSVPPQNPSVRARPVDEPEVTPMKSSTRAVPPWPAATSEHQGQFTMRARAAGGRRTAGRTLPA